MISHKHKCIFIHIPKAGGISIEQIFIDNLGLSFENRASLLLGKSTNKNLGPPFLSHLTAEEYLKYYFVSNEIFNNYFKFTIVRNPYSRVYSFYKYLGYIKLVSFEKFVIKYLPELFNDKTQYFFIKPMYNYIYNESGKKLVDFVGKLETINEDFKVIEKELKLGNTRLHKLNDSKNFNYKVYIIRSFRIIKKHPFIFFRIPLKGESRSFNYNESMKAIVQEYYSKDFDYFNYQK